MFAHFFFAQILDKPDPPIQLESDDEIPILEFVSKVTNLVFELIGGLPIFPFNGALHILFSPTSHPSGQLLYVGGNISSFLAVETRIEIYVRMRIRITAAMDITMKLNDAMISQYTIHYSTKKRIGQSVLFWATCE